MLISVLLSSPATLALGRPIEAVARGAAAALVLCTLLCLAPSLSRAQVTWTGGGDEISWDAPQNWSTGEEVSGSGDDVPIGLTPDGDHDSVFSRGGHLDVGWALDYEGVVEVDLQSTGSSHYLRLWAP